MIATKGEPYLKIPEDKSFSIMRTSLGVYASIAVCSLISVILGRAFFGSAS